MAVGADGTVYVADNGNHRIAKILANGTIQTVAKLNDPLRVAIGPSGALYVIDGEILRRIATDGTVSVLAGGAFPSLSSQPPQVGQAAVAATSVALDSAFGLAVDANENVSVEINCSTGSPLCVRPVPASSTIDVVAKITPGGQLTTIYDPNPSVPRTNFPGSTPPLVIGAYLGLALDAAGNLLVGTNSGVVELDLTGKPTGTVFPGVATSNGSQAFAAAASDFAVDPSGNIFFAVKGTPGTSLVGNFTVERFQVREETPAGIRTIYNDSLSDYQGITSEGGGPLAIGVATDASGNLYVSDENLHRIRKLAAGLCPVGVGPVISNVLDSATVAASKLTPPYYAVAPGELVSILGNGLGPADGVGPILDDNGFVPAVVAGSSVLFNGVPGRVLYASATLINAIVPFSVYGVSPVRVEVQYNGVTSDSVFVPGSDVEPNILPIVVNQDGTVNAASNPAAAGSVVYFYGIGFGRTTPPGTDGHLSSAPYPSPNAPVQLLSAGTLIYASDAPDIVEGVIQIDIRLPMGISQYTAQLQVGSATTSIPVAVHP